MDCRPAGSVLKFLIRNVDGALSEILTVTGSFFFRVLELEESLGSSHLLQQNIKQKDEKVSSLNLVIQEREEKLAELENRSELLILIYLFVLRIL